MGARVGYWATFAVTMALYAVIVGWSAPYISSQAGNAVIFDLRPMGYSFEEAAAFLQTLTPDGASFYHSVQLRLDLLYPVLMAATLCWALLWLMPPWKGRAVVLAAPILAMVFDYAENLYIYRMLIAGADGLTPDLVARASLFSQLKAAFSTVSFTLLLIVMGVWGYDKFRQSAKARPSARN